MRRRQWLNQRLNKAGQRKKVQKHLFGAEMTSAYLRRREMVKNFWLVAGAAMMVWPLLPWVVAVSLFTTFVSFMYLDEAPILIKEWQA